MPTDIARSVVSVFLVLGTRVDRAKTNELIEMPFGGQTRFWSQKPVLDGFAY